MKATESQSADQDKAIAFDDSTLVRSCQKGQIQAFGSLVAKYQDRLYNALLRICGDRDEAADLCQEAFLRAMENIAGFRLRSQFYTWLYRIAVNLAITYKRRAARVRVTSLSPDVEFGYGQAAALAREASGRRQDDPVREVMNRETHCRIQEALASLDDEFRAVVVLRDIEEMNYEQVAAVLRLPLGTVKSRLHRARCMLRDKLADIVGPVQQ